MIQKFKPVLKTVHHDFFLGTNYFRMNTSSNQVFHFQVWLSGLHHQAFLEGIGWRNSL